MRILLTGASGFIGSAVLAALLRHGHEVAAVVRGARAAQRLPEACRRILLDMRTATDPARWLPLLAGIDAVINCAGVLQDGLRDSTVGVHETGPAALFAACGQAGVRRVVHVSAIGVDDQATPFASTKLSGDRALMASDLDWVILRPSVVVGRAAYGGSALFRGLAALPLAVPSVADAGVLQIVQLDDLVRTILALADPAAPSRVVLEVVGPQRLTLNEILATYRRWLGYKTAPPVVIPGWLAALAYRAGDAAGLLGWRSPLRTTLARELARGSTGDPAQWTRLTHIEPMSLGAALAIEPASVQERWFARLYFLKPVTLAVLAVYWIATGLIALGPGWQGGVALMREAGFVGAAQPMAALGALADIAIGLGIAVQPTCKRALIAAIALSLGYIAFATLLMPGLWLDPLGPLLKVKPVIALTLMALAIADDR